MSQSSVAGNAALQRCITTFKVTLKTKQVLFLEAGKDFVDTLFSFLVLPVGTIIHMLSQDPNRGPSEAFRWNSSMFESVDSSFLRVDKNNLVRPRPAARGCTCGSSTGLQVQRDLEAVNILQPTPSRAPVLVYYKCTGCCGTLSSSKGAGCAACKATYKYNDYTFSVGPYNVQMQDSNEEVNRSIVGFVKGNITFIVTDNLEIMPSTTITSMSVLKKLEVASVADLESNEITVSITQILWLLHAALISNKCLNDVFGKI